MATGVVIFFASGFFGVAKKGQGRWSIQANVIHIENKKWTLVEPSVPAAPGVFAPYPTFDIRRNMNRPSCTAVQEERRDEEEVILYGCSRGTSKTSMLLQELEKVRFHPLMESRATFLFETPMKSVWTDPIGTRSTMKMSMAVIYSSTG